MAPHTRDAAWLEEQLHRAVRKVARSGKTLPPEKVLAQELGVSRGGLREALIRLEASGFVARRQGAGTFVNPLAVDMRLRIDGTFEFSDMLEAAGYDAGMTVLESGWAELTPKVAEQLQVEAGTLAFRTVKVWTADGRPVMTAEDIIPADEMVEVDAEDSVFVLAEQITGEATEWVATWLRPIVATRSLAKVLDKKVGAPLLQLKQVGVTREGRRCWWAHECHESDVLEYGLVRVVP